MPIVKILLLFNQICESIYCNISFFFYYFCQFIIPWFVSKSLLYLLLLPFFKLKQNEILYLLSPLVMDRVTGLLAEKSKSLAGDFDFPRFLPQLELNEGEPLTSLRENSDLD